MTERIEIARKWLDAMNQYDLEKMSSLCSEDAVSDEVAAPPAAEGRDAIAKSYRDLFLGFPDCKAEITNTFVGGNQVLAEVRWRGTNTANFKGTPATHKPVDIRIAYIFKIDEGKIRRITEYYDGAAVGAQMGLL